MIDNNKPPPPFFFTNNRQSLAVRLLMNSASYVQCSIPLCFAYNEAYPVATFFNSSFFRNDASCTKKYMPYDFICHGGSKMFLGLHPSFSFLN